MAYGNSFRRKKKLLIVIMALCLSAVLAPAAYGWYYVKYVDNDLLYGYTSQETCCFQHRISHTVWRPIGYLFVVSYIYTDGPFNYYDSDNNPIALGGSGDQDAIARCMNDTPYTLSPVTCRTTHP